MTGQPASLPASLQFGTKLRTLRKESCPEMDIVGTHGKHLVLRKSWHVNLAQSGGLITVENVKVIKYLHGRDSDVLTGGQKHQEFTAL